MDVLQLKDGPPVKWSETDGFVPVEIWINERRLIDQVREVELPLQPNIAGDYLSLPATMQRLPSRQLLDQPEGNDGKAILLGCPCGVIDRADYQVALRSISTR